MGVVTSDESSVGFNSETGHINLRDKIDNSHHILMELLHESVRAAVEANLKTLQDTNPSEFKRLQQDAINAMKIMAKDNRSVAQDATATIRHYWKKDRVRALSEYMAFVTTEMLTADGTQTKSSFVFLDQPLG